MSPGQRRADVLVTSPGGAQVRLGPASEAIAWHHAEGLRVAARWDPDAAGAVITVADHDHGCTHPDFLATLPRTAADVAAALADSAGQAGDWPGLYTRLILIHGHQDAAALWQQAGAMSPARLLQTERDRQERIAGLIGPCPPPDMLGGWDLCPCGRGGSWPCDLTRVAWLARGFDPETETRRIVHAIAQSADPDLEELDVPC